MKISFFQLGMNSSVSQYSISQQDLWSLLSALCRTATSLSYALWTVKAWQSTFGKSPQKLLGPTLCYSGLQIADVSAIWSSHLFLFDSVELQFYLGRTSPPSPESPSLEAHSPALPVVQCLKTAAYYILYNFIVSQQRASPVSLIFSWLEAEFWQFACKLCLPQLIIFTHHFFFFILCGI